MTKPQKGKHRKRRRGWHRGPGEDLKFDRAVTMLDQVVSESGHPSHEEQETRNKKEDQA